MRTIIRIALAFALTIASTGVDADGICNPGGNFCNGTFGALIGAKSISIAPPGTGPALLVNGLDPALLVNGTSTACLAGGGC